MHARGKPYYPALAVQYKLSGCQLLNNSHPGQTATAVMREVIVKHKLATTVHQGAHEAIWRQGNAGNAKEQSRHRGQNRGSRARHTAKNNHGQHRRVQPLVKTMHKLC
jgi:hypothetical protein